MLSKVCYTQTITWKDLDSIAEKNIQYFTYDQLPDTSLKIWFVQTPIKKKTPKCAAIIWIHGGAWVSGKASTFFANATYCNLNNAMGFSIEYRLLNKGNYSITNCIDDCVNAIQAIKAKHQQFNIDTNKIVLVGESAGGHLAAMIALQKKQNIKALVLYNPVLNCYTGTFIKYIHAPLLVNKQPLDTTKLLLQLKERAIALSPLYQVTHSLPPTLIVQGLNDIITPPEYAVSFKNILLKKQTSCKLELLPNTNHAFAIPHYKASEAQVIHALNSLTRFLFDRKIIKKLRVTITNSFSNTWYIRK
ncbi:MAG: alpha/beta hydrolase [Chitinophagaceae bacterium]